jgi:hypothetical protein
MKSRSREKAALVAAILAGLHVPATIVVPRLLDWNRCRGRIVAQGDVSI